MDCDVDEGVIDYVANVEHRVAFGLIGNPGFVGKGVCDYVKSLDNVGSGSYFASSNLGNVVYGLNVGDEGVWRKCLDVVMEYDIRGAGFNDEVLDGIEKALDNASEFVDVFRDRERLKEDRRLLSNPLSSFSNFFRCGYLN